MSKKCIKCGYERLPSDVAPDYECPKCGVIYAKAEAALTEKTEKILSGEIKPKKKPLPWWRHILNFIFLFMLALFLLILIFAGLTKYNVSQSEKEKIAYEIKTEKTKIKREALRKKAEENRAQARKERSQCNKSLQCWGDRNSRDAEIGCRDKIERFAKYDFKWVDGYKFSRFKWHRKPNSVTFIGDKIKFQNGFGAWQHYTYECDFDTKNRTALTVRVKPGRIR